MQNKIRFCPDIETISMIFVDIVFDFSERRTDVSSHLVKKDFAESISKKGIVEMFCRSPVHEITGTAMGRVTTMNHLVDIFDDGRHFLSIFFAELAGRHFELFFK